MVIRSSPLGPRGGGSGTRDFKVRSSQSASVLVDKSIALSSGTHYTMLVYGKRAAINTLMLTDDTTSPSSSGNSKLRAVGLSPDVGLVDLYLTSGDIGSIPPAQGGIAYGTANDYVEFAAGSFKIVMAVAGTKDIVFQSAAQTFTAGTAYTVAVFPPFGGKLVNALLIVNGAYNNTVGGTVAGAGNLTSGSLAAGGTFAAGGSPLRIRCRGSSAWSRRSCSHPWP